MGSILTVDHGFVQSGMGEGKVKGSFLLHRCNPGSICGVECRVDPVVFD